MESYLAKLIRVLGVGAAFATLPLLAAFSKLEPPNPPAIAYVSSALILLAALIAWEWGQGASRTLRRRRVMVSAVLCVAALLAYMYVYLSFVENIPGSEIRIVRGYVCTPQAIEVYREYCPDIPKAMIAEANWETKTLWTRQSVANVEIMLVAAWLVFTAGLIGAVGSIVSGERKKA
jgi:hypothetical protein